MAAPEVDPRLVKLLRERDEARDKATREKRRASLLKADNQKLRALLTSLARERPLPGHTG